MFEEVTPATLDAMSDRLVNLGGAGYADDEVEASARELGGAIRVLARFLDEGLLADGAQVRIGHYVASATVLLDRYEEADE